MKRMLFLVLLQTSFCTLRAQQHFYLFLQSESGKSYYARVQQKRYLANQAGEISIPGFSSGNYILRIGWGKPALSELAFPLRFQGNDLGLQLRQREDSSWALYDPGHRTWITALDSAGEGHPADSIEILQLKTDDGFARLLANVVNDSSMLYHTVERKGSWPAASPPMASHTISPEKDSTAVDRQARLEKLPVPESATASVSAELPPTGKSPVDSALRPGGQHLPGGDSGAALTQKAPPEEASVVRHEPVDSAVGVASVSAPQPSGAPADSLGVSSGSPIASNSTSGSNNPHSDSLTSQGVAADTIRKMSSLPAEVAADSLVAVMDSSASRNQSGKETDSLRDKPMVVVPEQSPAAVRAPDSSAPGMTIRGSARKLMENNFKEGLQLVYESLEPGGEKDTVRITIDAAAGHPDVLPRQRTSKLPAPSADGSATRPQQVIASQSLPEKKDSSVAQARALMAPGQPGAVLPEANGKAVLKQAPGADTLAMINSDCTQFAGDQDVDKLRISLLKAGSTDERIQVAGKVFRTRCFSTRQIRALSELFPDDAGKFRFFDLAYPHVSDTDHFRQLVDLFAGEEYARRFRVLLHMN